MKKLLSITKTRKIAHFEKAADWTAPYLFIILLLLIWQFLSESGIVPKFMLPSPIDVAGAFKKDFPLLMLHARITLLEAALGLSMGVILGFAAAVAMDHIKLVKKALYPILIISQTIPTVAIAPLLVLWLGYGILPKITLIILTSFFPITIGLLDGFLSADEEAVALLKAMGATPVQRFLHIKLPYALGHFFAALRISVSYSIVGAVIAEWLGGFEGLGVYMTRVKKSYAYDKMFAVIFFISALSLLFMYGVTVLQKKVMPWTKCEKNF